MESVSIRRPENVDKILIGVSLLGMATFLYFLINDAWMHKRSNDGLREKIGTVTELKLDVRRRSKDEFIWLPIEKRLPVFQGDSIFTGAQSTTTIKLDSGIKLVVDPDSLIVLEQSSDAMKLDLKFGQLRGTIETVDKKKVPPKITLKVNNSDMALAGKSVEFAMEKVKARETRLKVTKGTAQLIDAKTQKKVEVHQNQQIRITTPPSGTGSGTGSGAGNGSGTLAGTGVGAGAAGGAGAGGASTGAAATATFEVTAPEVFAPETTLDFSHQTRWAMPRNLWLPQKQALNFSWETEGEIDSYEFTLSENPDMSKPLVKERLSRPHFSWNPTNDAGKVYWQVKATSEKKKESITSDVVQWSYTLLTAPNWINVQSPLMVSKIDLLGTDKKKPIELFVSWDEPLKASQYRLEWSRNAEFNDAQASDLEEPRWRIPKWMPGQYFLRVRSEAIGRPPAIWSKPLSVIVTDQDPEGLVPPELALNELEVEANKGRVTLDWKHQEHATDYVIELSEEEDFSKLSNSFKSKKPSWTLGAQPIRSAFLRVVPLSAKGHRGPVSKTIKYFSRATGPRWLIDKNEIEIEIPRDGANHLLPFPDTIVQWKDGINEKAKLYYLEQSLKPDFSHKQSIDIPVKQMILKNLEAGDYYYRLRASYYDDTVSILSDVLHVHVTEKDPNGIPEPVMVSKTLESQLNLDDVAVTTVKWKKIKEAQNYVVQMSEVADFKTLVFEKKPEVTQFEVTVHKMGSYFIRVAAVSKKGEQGAWAPVVPWTVSLGAPILSPMSNITIEVESSDSAVPLTPLVVSWKAHRSLSHYNLQISDDADFKNIVLDQKVTGSEFKYNLVKGGKYRARVKGLDPDGGELTAYSAAEAMSFILKHPLNKPILLFPKNKISYVLAKMKTSELWLEWENKDKLATSFVVEFSREKEFTDITHKVTSTEPRLLLDHKNIKGKIYWRVKALNEDQQLSSNWTEPWALSIVDVLSED